MRFFRAFYLVSEMQADDPGAGAVKGVVPEIPGSLMGAA